MTYLSWAVLYEGSSDQAYFDVLIPRVMEELVIRDGVRNSTIPSSPSVRLRRGSVAETAEEACAARQAFHIAFIHADTGGRNLEAGMERRSVAYCEAMHAVCEWPPARCVSISPRHETEAWVLADPGAVVSALGFHGSATSIGLPANATEAERLVDPKAVLLTAVREVRGRRSSFNVSQIFPAIAQQQSFISLRESASFVRFEAALRGALADLGCV